MGEAGTVTEPSGGRPIEVRVPHMRTVHCAARIRRSVHALGPAVFAEFDMSNRCVIVTGADSESAVLKALQRAGYFASIVRRDV